MSEILCTWGFPRNDSYLLLGIEKYTDVFPEKKHSVFSVPESFISSDAIDTATKLQISIVKNILGFDFFGLQILAITFDCNYGAILFFLSRARNRKLVERLQNDLNRIFEENNHIAVFSIIES